MKILIVNYEYPPVGGGAATASSAMARVLVKMGHEVFVLTTQFAHNAGIVMEEGVSIIRVGSMRRRRESASVLEMLTYIFRAGLVVRRIVVREKIDASIAFFSIPGGPIAWWAREGTGVPYIISLRGGDVPGAEPGLKMVHRLLTPIRRSILRSSKAIVANSFGLKAMAEKADPMPVLVIPNGVDTSFFSPDEKLRTKGGTVRFLFVGRFQSQKNLPWLLDRMSDVRKLSNMPFVLDLVGDGPQLPELRLQAASLQIDDVVRFHGWEHRTMLKSRYQAADLVLNPSLYEGMPNVLLEAMACGRAVLASRVPGNEALVIHGVNGWLYSSNNAVEFLDLILQFLKLPDLAESLGAAARRRVVSEFSWETTTKRYLELLLQPIAKAAPP